MEGPAAAGGADDEYMTMDADQWSAQDDTYENGDTLGLDSRETRGHESGPDSRGQRKEELEKGKVAKKRPQQQTQNPNTAKPPARHLPERYITMRCPPLKANRRPLPQLVFFKVISACLVVLCILLLGALFGLSIYYDRLSGTQRNKTEQVLQLLEENRHLKEKIDILKYLSIPIYHVSRTKDPNCSSGNDLYILNYQVLEQVKGNWFHLGNKLLANGTCTTPFSWNCTSNHK
ncbi:uncharacterized protein LOC121185920 isoform X2 [Toxotes jaculatrix]|uniref:uncharacterized protein LOC121185920 isoform X2 n=1 Tax=Toxotes jaculatrix TaxID=941984 RepID=UPI001B3ABA59|nr:uncharacterized protein LOC121185920 isoform X2 [Toxotes jaculatrix]